MIHQQIVDQAGLTDAARFAIAVELLAQMWRKADGE